MKFELLLLKTVKQIVANLKW